METLLKPGSDQPGSDQPVLAPPPERLLESKQTCLDEEELLGLGAHLVCCCAVVAAKVTLGVRRDLTERKEEEVLTEKTDELQVNLRG